MAKARDFPAPETVLRPRISRYGPLWRLKTAWYRGRQIIRMIDLGLAATDHCVILQRMLPEAFTAAIGQCDIVLDSIDWSGFNSTIEGLPHDLPIVTNRSITLLGGAAIGHPVQSCKPAVQSLHSPKAARGFTLG